MATDEPTLGAEPEVVVMVCASSMENPDWARNILMMNILLF